MRTDSRLNSTVAGIIAGIVVPVGVYFILYFAKVQSIHTTLFSNRELVGNIFPVLISHCVLPNLVIFLVANGAGWTRAAKGILASTVAITVILFAVKFIFAIT